MFEVRICYPSNIIGRGYCECENFEDLGEAACFVRDMVDLIGEEKELLELLEYNPAYVELNWVTINVDKDYNVWHATMWTSLKNNMHDLMDLLDKGYYMVYGPRNGAVERVWVDNKGNVTNLTDFSIRERNKFLESKHNTFLKNLFN